MQTSYKVECPWESRRERRHLGSREHKRPSLGHGVRTGKDANVLLSHCLLELRSWMPMGQRLDHQPTAFLGRGGT